MYKIQLVFNCVYFARSTAQEPKQDVKTAVCREHAYSQLTTKLQPCHPEATTGSTMRVWQVRAVLCLVAFIGSCFRSPDHVIVSYEHRTAQSLSLATTVNNSIAYMQRACLSPAGYKTTPCRPTAVAGSTMHALVAGPRCPIANSFYLSLR